jgi:hypothetical protein
LISTKAKSLSLGGGTPTIHSSIYNILLVICISMFRFLFFVVLVLISIFQNTKRPKIFLLFLFVCLFSFLVLVCFTSYFWFDIWKIQKYFALFAVSSVLALKFENPKLFVVLLWFCKVCCRTQSPVTPLELGIHFILFKPHKWKAIMTTYDNSRCGKRLVWTLFVFHFCTYTHLCGHA